MKRIHLVGMEYEHLSVFAINFYTFSKKKTSQSEKITKLFVSEVKRTKKILRILKLKFKLKFREN